MGGFVVVVDTDVGLGGVRAVEASGVLDDAAREGDGRRQEERVEAWEVEAFAEERRGGEKDEALADVGEAREVGEDGGAFAAGDGAVEAVEGDERLS